ncbi:EboA domain-containing protein [Streptomyces vastus]|uniref:EboA domain-containing protein n=1 Tax=Streptomyces vastus TaxID=285451 RepID=UPI003CD06BC2
MLEPGARARLDTSVDRVPADPTAIGVPFPAVRRRCGRARIDDHWTVDEAALGPYAARHLPDDEYRQAVLKCVFHEIPLDRVAGLGKRADTELARMPADFARERIAAGRGVPEDTTSVIRAFAPAALDGVP